MNAAQHTVLYANSSVPQFLRPVVPPVHHSASNGQTAHCSRDTGGNGAICGEESSGSGPGRASDRRQTALIVGECHE
ncbi:hypothetical protein J6590_103509, partial [Homalodisca vitripennis]